MRLHDVKPNPGAKHRRRRVGNGESSGLGKTCGKGHKGQKSRSGASIRPNFEGGQMPIFRRLPKKGFNNAQFKTNFAIVNLCDLDAKFDDGATVNEESLLEAGLIKGIYDQVKLLGNGELSKKLTIEVYKASNTAKEAVKKAGGSVNETFEAVEAEKVQKNQKGGFPEKAEKFGKSRKKKIAKSGGAEPAKAKAEKKAAAPKSEPKAKKEEAAAEEE